MLSVPREKWDEVNCGELEPLIPGARDPAKTDIEEIRMNRNRKYCCIILWSDSSVWSPGSRLSRSRAALFQHEHFALWCGTDAWLREPA